MNFETDLCGYTESGVVWIFSQEFVLFFKKRPNLIGLGFFIGFKLLALQRYRSFKKFKIDRLKKTLQYQNISCCGCDSPAAPLFSSSLAVEL